MSNDRSKTIKVKNTEDLKLALDAGYEAAQIEIDHSEAIKAAAAANPPDVAAIEAKAAAGERVRIAGLQNMAEPGFENELKAAIESGASVETFAHTLLVAMKDRGISLKGVRSDAPNPAPHAKPGTDEKQPVGTGASWDRFNNPASQKQRM